MTKEDTDRLIKKFERFIASMTLEEAKKYYASFGLELRENKWREWQEKYSDEECQKIKIKTT